MKNIAKLFIYIEFSNDDLPLKDIKEIWRSDDVFFSMKGSSYLDFKEDKKIERHREKDYCNIRYEVMQQGISLCEMVINLLHEQQEKIKYITKICKGVYKKVHVCIYPEIEQYNIDFSTELIKLLLELDMEMGATILQL